MQDINDFSAFDIKLPFKFFTSKEVTSRTCGIPHVDSMELLSKKQSPMPTNKSFVKSQQQKVDNVERTKTM